MRPRLYGPPLTSRLPFFQGAARLSLPGVLPGAGVNGGDLAALLAAWYDLGGFAGVIVQVEQLAGAVSGVGTTVSALWSDDPVNQPPSTAPSVSYQLWWTAALNATGTPARTYLRNRGRYLNLTVDGNGFIGPQSTFLVSITPCYEDASTDLASVSTLAGSGCIMLTGSQVVAAAGNFDTEIFAGGPACLNVFSTGLGDAGVRVQIALRQATAGTAIIWYNETAPTLGAGNYVGITRRLVIPMGAHRVRLTNLAAGAQTIGASLIPDLGIAA